jgi:hypothetical protein
MSRSRSVGRFRQEIREPDINNLHPTGQYPHDLAAIGEAVPAGAVAGERYAAPLMTTLDSER